MGSRIITSGLFYGWHSFSALKNDPGSSEELAFNSKFSCLSGSAIFRLLITIHKIGAIKFKAFRVFRRRLQTIKSFWADVVEKTSAQLTRGRIADLPLQSVIQNFRAASGIFKKGHFLRSFTKKYLNTVFGKRVLFCQVLQGEASDYPTLISFGLFFALLRVLFTIHQSLKNQVSGRG